MSRLLISSFFLLWAATCTLAAERKPIEEVDSDQFTADTQVTPAGAGDDHVALVWWIPNEFWESILARDSTTAEADKQAMLDAMAGISLLAVVQADISQFGAFDFYSMEEVAEHMEISYTNDLGKQQNLVPMEDVNPDLEVVLGVFKPILGGAMGNLGNNMHFYVLGDVSENADRILDPYEQGVIHFQLKRRDQGQLTGEIDLPLNALFVPRKCPNGKDAHVSWQFCPWSGERLPE